MYQRCCTGPAGGAGEGEVPSVHALAGGGAGGEEANAIAAHGHGGDGLLGNGGAQIVGNVHGRVRRRGDPVNKAPAH